MKVPIKAFSGGPGILGDFMRKHEAKHAELESKFGSNYDKPAMSFSLNKAELAVVDAWVESLRPEIMAKQGGADPFGQPVPYYGATGGGVTYSFIPTSLGTIILARESTTGKELNVSNALDWFFYG